MSDNMNIEQSKTNFDKTKSLKKITYSYDEYNGLINNEIIILFDKLNECKIIQNKIEEKIKNIQNNCIHEYMFSSKGMYDDNYICKLCGNESEH
jgi:hypothetical protein